MTTLTDKEKRDVYYIYRAMHDGVCPSCGFTAPREDFMFGCGLKCQNCEFEITADESIAIESIGVDAVSQRLATFKSVRDQLIKQDKRYEQSTGSGT